MKRNIARANASDLFRRGDLGEQWPFLPSPNLFLVSAL